jgi:hypothetical protein
MPFADLVIRNTDEPDKTQERQSHHHVFAAQTFELEAPRTFSSFKKASRRRRLRGKSTKMACVGRCTTSDRVGAAHRRPARERGSGSYCSTPSGWNWTCGQLELCSHVCQVGLTAPSRAVTKIPQRAKRLGDIVLNIDRFGLVVLGDFLQTLFLLRIRRRLGLTLRTRGLVAKIISGGVNISVHGGATSDRLIRSPSPHPRNPSGDVPRLIARCQKLADACHRPRLR